MTVLSHIQVSPVITSSEGEIQVSLDLNRSLSTCLLGPDGLGVPNGIISRTQLKKIAKDENGCFLFEDGEIVKIQAYSEDFARTYSLFPTKTAPTMRVAGFPMHRIKDTDPIADTEAKMRALSIIRGDILDTATGLGYTAIAAAKKADVVTTIEIDPIATEICRYNPWSDELFAGKIKQLYGDAFEVVDTFADSRFDSVIHDPPTRQLAGELYSEEFYAKVRRILRSGGRFFHYIGDPDSALGKSTTEGVIRRIRLAGFKSVERHPQAYGIVAV